MELPILHLMQITPEEISWVRQQFGLDEDTLRRSVDELMAWFKAQEFLAHLHRYARPDIAERILILSQGSKENSKTRLEKILIRRGIIPEITLNKTFEEFNDFLDNMCVFPVAKHNPLDHTRIIIASITTENYQDFNILTFVRFIFVLAEFRTFYEYVFADRYIVDLKNFKANFLTRLNPVTINKALMTISDSYGIKMKGIHIINAPSFIDKIINLLKQALKEKIANRIQVHKSIDELYEVIDRDILPPEYGGKGPSCREIVDQWRKYFETEDAKYIISESNNFYLDEDARKLSQYNDEYLGIPGTFKQLTFD